MASRKGKSGEPKKPANKPVEDVMASVAATPFDPLPEITTAGPEVSAADLCSAVKVEGVEDAIECKDDGKQVVVRDPKQRKQRPKSLTRIPGKRRKFA